MMTKNCLNWGGFGHTYDGPNKASQEWNVEYKQMAIIADQQNKITKQKLKKIMKLMKEIKAEKELIRVLGRIFMV